MPGFKLNQDGRKICDRCLWSGDGPEIGKCSELKSGEECPFVRIEQLKKGLKERQGAADDRKKRIAELGDMCNVAEASAEAMCGQIAKLEAALKARQVGAAAVREVIEEMACGLDQYDRTEPEHAHVSGEIVERWMLRLEGAAGEQVDDRPDRVEGICDAVCKEIRRAFEMKPDGMVGREDFVERVRCVLARHEIEL